jgi:hypothetical protein
VSTSAFAQLDIVNEVKALSQNCYVTEKLDDGQKEYVTQTIDRIQPYKFDRPHKGISRTLQSFETVLLTVLVREGIKVGGLPISLDHDGALFAFKTSKIQNLELEHLVTEGLIPWSQYLLGVDVPVEAKTRFSLGKIN